MSDIKKGEPKSESAPQPRLHNFETAPIANSIFEIGEKGIQVAGQGFLIGSIFGMVFLSNPQSMNTFGTCKWFLQHVASTLQTYRYCIQLFISSPSIIFYLLVFLAGAMHYEQIANSMGKCGVSIFMRIFSVPNFAIFLLCGSFIPFTLANTWALYMLIPLPFVAAFRDSLRFFWRLTPSPCNLCNTRKTRKITWLTKQLALVSWASSQEGCRL